MPGIFPGWSRLLDKTPRPDIIRGGVTYKDLSRSPIMPGEGVGMAGQGLDPLSSSALAPDPRSTAVNLGLTRANRLDAEHPPILLGGGQPTAGRSWKRAALLAALLGGTVGASQFLGGGEAEVPLEAASPQAPAMAAPQTDEAGVEDPDAQQALAMALLLRIINEGRQRQDDIAQFGYVKTPRGPLTLDR
jgi:hypothetical protein